MKYIKNIIYIILLIPCISQAQGIVNYWHSGYQGWGGRPFGTSVINFINNQPDTSWENRKMYFDWTVSQISDSSGNLLFTSNGLWIADASNDTIQNGSGLISRYNTIIEDTFGVQFPQANLVLRDVVQNNIYYLFHVNQDHIPGTYYSLHLYRTTIDMNLNGGLGGVIQKNEIVYSDTIQPGNLTACRHANGRDWWIIILGYGYQSRFDNRIIKFLYTPFGLLGPYIQAIGSDSEVLGQIVFSQDGTKLARYVGHASDLDVFDFDRCTGDLTFLFNVSINDSTFAGGVAFSSTGNTLYLSSGNYVYQLDMTAANIPSTFQTVAVFDGFYDTTFTSTSFKTQFLSANLAPDGKIYINTTSGTTFMHVINYPDSLGTACDVCQHCIKLPSVNYHSTPNYPNYFLGADTNSVCDSLSTGMFMHGYNHLNLKAWPIPTTSGSNIMLTYHTLNDKGLIELYNTHGTLLKTYPLPPWSQTQTIKLPELAGGVYLLRLVSGERKGSVKIMVE
ncbi:MAG: hypothetical protein RIQ89_837 [Bacteroidota bacterium]|jgi:hypothetical protein